MAIFGAFGNLQRSAKSEEKVLFWAPHYVKDVLITLCKGCRGTLHEGGCATQSPCFLVVALVCCSRWTAGRRIIPGGDHGEEEKTKKVQRHAGSQGQGPGGDWHASAHTPRRQSQKRGQ